MFYYKDSACGFGCLYWLHQWGIPYRSCRFHCCLAAHQRTKEMDSAGVPLLYPKHACVVNWTLTPHPGVIRCGGALWLPRFIPIQIACIRCYRLSPVPNIVQLSVFGLWSFAFQLGCPACIARFSLLGEGSFVCAATSCFAMVFRRICANRGWSNCFG